MTLSLLAAASALLLATTQAAPLAAAQSSVDVDFYQGQLSFTGLSTITAQSCGSTRVASGSLNTGVCNAFGTFGIGIHDSPAGACTLQFFKGTNTCDPSFPPITINLGQDADTTCVNTGVLDGGRFYKASGIFTCS